MEILHNDSHEHVEDEEADEEEEADEVDQAPFVEVFAGLEINEAKDDDDDIRPIYLVGGFFLSFS